MRYEITDHEWAAITPMLPNKPRGVKSTASFGCCDPGRLRGICRTFLDRTPPATIASSGGGGRASGAKL